MSGKTSIEWTDATWNPVRGCSRVSEGCRNCYAEGIAARFNKPGQAFEGLAEMVTIGKGTLAERTEPHWTGKVRLVEEHLCDPLGWKKPRRIFVNSMSDLFHEELPFTIIGRVFAIMALAKQHTFQILTKRPARAMEFCKMLPKPLPNVWLGVSVENQRAADERIPLLIETPAAVRFLSIEPLLGPVDLDCWVGNCEMIETDGKSCARCIADQQIHWVIVGGESGRGARPMHPEWARTIQNQCDYAGIPFFFKQWGEWHNGSSNQPSPSKPNLVVLGDGKALTFEEGTKPSNRYKGDLACVMARVGKKAAGRKLDGKEHKRLPCGV